MGSCQEPSREASFCAEAPCCPCRFFYASSACIYPENKQLDTEIEGGGLKEKDAWPAQVSKLGPPLLAAHLLQPPPCLLSSVRLTCLITS